MRACLYGRYSTGRSGPEVFSGVVEADCRSFVSLRGQCGANRGAGFSRMNQPFRRGKSMMDREGDLGVPHKAGV